MDTREPDVSTWAILSARGDSRLTHSFADIVAIGDNTTTNLKVGDAVGVKWLADSCLGEFRALKRSCETSLTGQPSTDCEVCREGQEATCQKAETSGYSKDGSFQQ